MEHVNNLGLVSPNIRMCEADTALIVDFKNTITLLIQKAINPAANNDRLNRYPEQVIWEAFLDNLTCDEVRQSYLTMDENDHRVRLLKDVLLDGPYHKHYKDLDKAISALVYDIQYAITNLFTMVDVSEAYNGYLEVKPIRDYTVKIEVYRTIAQAGKEMRNYSPAEAVNKRAIQRLGLSAWHVLDIRQITPENIPTGTPVLSSHNNKAPNGVDPGKIEYLFGQTAPAEIYEVYWRTEGDTTWPCTVQGWPLIPTIVFGEKPNE